MKTLYANGCSFTLGDELSHPEVQRFPSIIAKERGWDVVNQARCGAGNEEICRKTMDYLMDYIKDGKDVKSFLEDSTMLTELDDDFCEDVNFVKIFKKG